MHAKERWIRLSCSEGHARVVEGQGGGIPTYEGALDSRGAHCKVRMGRRSQGGGGGISTYEGALYSNPQGVPPSAVRVGARVGNVYG